jgi:hypothetical protein
MKKIISFSLWGDDEKYTYGALHNIELAKKVYPDWICRFYIGTSVPPHIVKQIEKADNTEVIKMSEEGDWTGMFWRFYAAGDPQVDVVISRDCDSRLWYREKAAVDEWLAGDKDFHIMRDHPAWHNLPILGGMWGARNGVVSDINKFISQYQKGDFYQVDQNFLRDVIYPIIKNNICVHDDFDIFNDVCEKKPFPYNRDSAHFAGQAYKSNGDPIFLSDDDKRTNNSFQRFIEKEIKKE